MSKKVYENDDYSESELFGNRGQQTEGVLSRYYRIPGLNVRLPTGGAFLPPGSFHPTMTGEVPVFPMRAADELLLKSPDALMSGFAIEKLIESCVPAIENPREISTPDLDVVLLAIRAATYGDMMPVSAACPKCKHVSEFECHLPGMVATVSPIPAENPVRLADDIVVYVRPFNLSNATRVAVASFEEARRMQSLDGAEDATRRQAMNESFQRLSELNVAMASDCVVRVVVPEGSVTDKKEIAQFVGNMQRKWFRKVEDKLKELNQMGMNKKLDVQCEKCEHTWQTEVEFDPASFFDSGS